MYIECNTHLISVDRSEVFIHLINGIPLCRERRERSVLGSGTHSHASLSLYINMYQSVWSIFISHMIVSAYVSHPHDIKGVLALTPSETRSDCCYTSSIQCMSHTLYLNQSKGYASGFQVSGVPSDLIMCDCDGVNVLLSATLQDCVFLIFLF